MDVRDESGWTLIELTIATVLMLIVGGAALAAIQSIRESQDSTTSKEEALAEGRTALQQMARDARQAVSIGVPAGGRQLYLVAYDRPAGTSGSLAQSYVRYDCTQSSNSACVRTLCNAVPANVLTGSCTATETRTVARDIVTSGQIFTPELNQSQYALGTLPVGTQVNENGTLTTLGSGQIDFLNIDLNLKTNSTAPTSTGRSGRASNLNPVDLSTGVNLESAEN